MSEARLGVVYEPMMVTIARHFIAWPILASIGQVSDAALAFALVIWFGVLRLGIHGRKNPFGRRPLLSESSRGLPWAFVVVGSVLTLFFWVWGALEVAEARAVGVRGYPGFTMVEGVALVGITTGILAVVALARAAGRMGDCATIDVPIDPTEPLLVTRPDGSRMQALGADGFIHRAGQTLTVIAAHDERQTGQAPYRGATRSIRIDEVFEGTPAQARSRLRGKALSWAFVTIFVGSSHATYFCYIVL